jgi:hypothetical protein
VRGELFYVFEDPLDKAAGGFRLVQSDIVGMASRSLKAGSVQII